MQSPFDLTFSNEKEGLIAVGMTNAIFALITRGYITFSDASECFSHSEFQLRQMYDAWAKKNLPP